MAKGKSVLKPLPPAKVSKSVSMDGSVWDDVDKIRDRIKQIGAQVTFDINEIIEDAVREAVNEANGALDKLAKSPTKA